MVDLLASPLVHLPPGAAAVTSVRDIDYGCGDPTLRMDVYRPVGSGPWPAVLFVHGDGDADELRRAKDWGVFVGWGRAAAASGLLGVTFSHRSWDRLRHVPRKLADVEAAVRFLRRKGPSLGARPDRLGMMCVSAGV